MSIFSIAKKPLDDQLIMAYLQQQRINEAVQAMYEAWFEETIGYIEKQGGSWDDGADIFQESMLTLVEKVRNGEYKAQSSLKTFLTGIAKNKWATEQRTRGRRARREATYQDTHTQDEDYEHWLSETTGQLEGVFGQLGDICQRILIGFYWQKKSMRALLESTDFKNEQVLRNKKTTCMKQLKVLLQQGREAMELK